MTRKALEGSFVALVTPFGEDGSVALGAFRTWLRFQRDHGPRAVLVMGSTGESTLLTAAERQRIVVETARVRTERVRLFYGCTGGSTEATVANVRFAREPGADGAILAGLPSICASGDDVERILLEVADATGLPLGISDLPEPLGHAPSGRGHDGEGDVMLLTLSSPWDSICSST